MNRILFLVVLILSVIFCTGGGCGDSPTGSEGGTDEYPMYYVDYAQIPPKLYALYPSSGRIDSATIWWSATEGIAASANGDRLYLADRNKISVIDTDTFQLLTTLPYESDNAIGVSSDGNLIAVANENGLTVLRTEDYGVEFTDTLSVWNCEFTPSGNAIYCGCRGTEGAYYVDLAAQPPAGVCLDVGDGATVYVFATRNESKLLLYKLVGANLWSFEVFDVAVDSVIFSDYISPGAGQMVMSPDGRLVFYTSPGAADMSVPPLMGFKVFDVEANRISRIIVDQDYFGGDWYIAPPRFLTVSPDGRWLGIVGGTRARLAVYIYDIRNDEMVGKIGPTAEWLPWLSNITSQKSR